MPWFKVDDRLHDHHKTRQVRRSDPDKARDVAPFGLWTLAGSWCGSNPTHGFIPLEVLQEWDDHAEEYADRLVAARLWTSDEVNGEPGYRFHDWEDRNPVDGDDPSSYGRRGNHIRWHEKRGSIDPECEFCRPESPRLRPEEPDGTESGSSQFEEDPYLSLAVDSDDSVKAQVTPGNIGAIRGANPPVPSRPDPTRPIRMPGKRAADLDTDPDFVAFWSAYPRRTDKGHARKAWLAMLKAGHDPQKVIAGARSFAEARRGADPKFVPHPATWLNGERWTDEAMTQEAGAPYAPDVLEDAPPGMSPEEYATWERGARERQRQAR